MKVRCSRCGQSYRAAEKLAGKTIRCQRSGCDGNIAIPMTSTASKVPFDDVSSHQKLKAAHDSGESNAGDLPSPNVVDKPRANKAAKVPEKQTGKQYADKNAPPGVGNISPLELARQQDTKSDLLPFWRNESNINLLLRALLPTIKTMPDAARCVGIWIIVGCVTLIGSLLLQDLTTAVRNVSILAAGAGLLYFSQAMYILAKRPKLLDCCKEDIALPLVEPAAVASPDSPVEPRTKIGSEVAFVGGSLLIGFLLFGGLLAFGVSSAAKWSLVFTGWSALIGPACYFRGKTFRDRPPVLAVWGGFGSFLLSALIVFTLKYGPIGLLAGPLAALIVYPFWKLLPIALAYAVYPIGWFATSFPIWLFGVVVTRFGHRVGSLPQGVAKHSDAIWKWHLPNEHMPNHNAQLWEMALAGAVVGFGVAVLFRYVTAYAHALFNTLGPIPVGSLARWAASGTTPHLWAVLGVLGAICWIKFLNNSCRNVSEGIPNRNGGRSANS